MTQPNKEAILATRSMWRNILIAFAAVALFFGGGVAWSAFTNISGAVIASGRLEVDSKLKRIQHVDGGIVRSINVKDGDHVKAGDVLITLDDTLLIANYEILNQRLIESWMMEARLVAESVGNEKMDFPAPLIGREQVEAVQKAFYGQSELLESRNVRIEGQIKQLREQIAQSNIRIEGINAQIAAKQEEDVLLKEELEDLEGLFKKNLIPKSRVMSLRREKARNAGEIGSLISQNGTVQNEISGLELQIIQIQDQRETEVLEQLQEARATISQLLEEYTAAEERLARIKVRAPYPGVIHELSVHSEEEVIPPGGDIMQIVPEDDSLIVEAMVNPVDIDQIYSGQKARLRMSSLDQRFTPELYGTLIFISGDSIADEKTGQQFYRVRLTIDEGETDKLNGEALVPGMPTDVFIQKSDRSVLSYLVKPLQDQIAHAFRE